MKSHMHWKELGYAVGVVALLAAIYVGAYYVMVERIDYILIAGKQYHAVRYPFGGEESEWLFAPMHELDRKIRPARWENQAPYVSGAQLTRERLSPGVR